MAKTGLLVLTNPSTFTRLLPAIKEKVQKTLYVHLSPQKRLTPPWVPSSEPVLKPHHFKKSVVGLYTQSIGFRHNLDVRVLLSSVKYPLVESIKTSKKIEVVFFDKHYSKDEINKFVQCSLSNTSPTCQIVTLNAVANDGKAENHIISNDDLEKSIQNLRCEDNPKMYNNVVLGGTFDRLHVGHKILLTEALLHCSEKLTVGVTDSTMLKSKTLWELIEPCEKRINDVKDFLADVDCGVHHHVVPISDPFGPTQEDPNLQMIVVSAETLKGGAKVNEVRSERGLPPLDVLSIELVESSPAEYDVEEPKISSSNHRMRLLGMRLRTPEGKSHLPSRPYIVGLTGTIASGKSSVGKRFAQLGAGLVNCDLLAHGLYKKGEPCYDRLVQHFGERILDADGEVDRKVLGSIVFNDKEQLAVLNHLLWPSIWQRARAEADRLHQAGHQVVVMDAAVLLQANWDRDCHEVWVCIISPEEAIKRIQKRNGLTAAEAEARVLSQPSNLELVGRAHMVFCTLWAPECTQKQVEKAWKYLQHYLDIQAKL